ncbi:hypothetical protein UL82_07270 [Corynebacterium kutscheri]|uniref:Uncharacterized protein n=1 Tax=Corynebacterium kutscheri TaxID=35755 RepID=A0A0F6TDD0_9CORY|nr:hypothetical protein [Corynebacterium kutscheri]AKE41616.1 hypothetical protein UL82_07270 [Corynebacterium kutscheri]VEH09942.1 Uncharacterised protein [Corynebacterium kutscheri]
MRQNLSREVTREDTNPATVAAQAHLAAEIVLIFNSDKNAAIEDARETNVYWF